jgi:tRNA 2-thiouridine synthesizing protein A
VNLQRNTNYFGAARHNPLIGVVCGHLPTKPQANDERHHTRHRNHRIPEGTRRARLNCPLPILKAKKALAELASGEVLRIVATDTGSVRDFQAFAKQTGNALLAHRTSTANSLLMRRKSASSGQGSSSPRYESP